jgi:hypothetical protein
MAAVDDLVRTRKGWAVVAPTQCPAGHEFGPGRVHVGTAVCTGDGGRHQTWRCEECGEITFAPELGPHCSVLDGPAAVRISNHAYDRE